MPGAISRFRPAVAAVIVAWTALGSTANNFQLLSTLDPSQEAPAGAGGNSAAPVISPDGRYVLFVSGPRITR